MTLEFSRLGLGLVPEVAQALETVGVVSLAVGPEAVLAE
jgi:hypothetical protein